MGAQMKKYCINKVLSILKYIVLMYYKSIVNSTVS